MTTYSPAKYRTTNWPTYNAALKSRGSLMLWIDKEMSWQGEAAGKRGRIRGRLRKRIIKYAKLCEGRSAYFLLAISPPLKDAHEIAAQHPPLFFDLT